MPAAADSHQKKPIARRQQQGPRIRQPQGAPKGGPQGDPQGAPGGAPEGYVGPPRGGGVRIWDVGVGANCVYPLLGFADYGWRFVGSDISEESLAAAAANLHANGLEVYVQLRLQQQPQQIFEGVLRDEDGLFAACVCNPPFYSSPELVAKSPWREKAGKLHELACAGGEAAFLRCMYTESKAHAARFLWFTSLVARTSTRDELKRQIQHGMRLAGRRAEQQMEAEAQRWLRRHRLQRGQSCSSSSSSSGGGGGSCSSSSSSSGSCSGAEEVEMHPRELRVFDLFQGKQTRWVVCWTYWTAAQRRQLREILYSDSAG
ncbi:hypothetical protein, conserved [Eimeria tenella]|uniref:Uncharacterized protein n=1 Tax=Eimeria tenella TaxID=5802 RepID=U6L578_EIMTE|nr:hypothetical protein, conserved [Eimeria tenella]CDJ45542.1 hypothetical protein, conserved [Eimeria tenella]|eukprot:XP_013236288.1 hypothetical protein, conserved [Eimeria tenella]